MKTFTFGTTPEEDIENHLPECYMMDLNETDANDLLNAIDLYCKSTNSMIAKEVYNQICQRCIGFNKNEMKIILKALYANAFDNENCWSLRSGILQTIGIEEI